jgi:hypothetical protein
VKGDTNFFNADVTFISETWAQPLESDSVYALDNFSTFRTDSNGNDQRRHQGILFYGHDRIRGLEIDNKLSLPGLQMMHISFLLPDSSRLYVLGVYKAPQLFIQDFPTHLGNELLGSEDERMLIIGDFNIDLLQTDGSTEKLQSLFRTRSFSQCVSTHTTDHGSLLDHVWVNFDTSKPSTCLLEAYFSDHSPIATHVSLF